MVELCSTRWRCISFLVLSYMFALRCSPEPSALFLLLASLPNVCGICGGVCRPDGVSVLHRTASQCEKNGPALATAQNLLKA